MAFINPARLIQGHFQPLSIPFMRGARHGLVAKNLAQRQPYLDARRAYLAEKTQEMEQAQNAFNLLRSGRLQIPGIQERLPKGMTPSSYFTALQAGAVKPLDIGPRTPSYPYASSGLGIFHKETGEIVHPTPEKPEDIQKEKERHIKRLSEIAHDKATLQQTNTMTAAILASNPNLGALGLVPGQQVTPELRQQAFDQWDEEINWRRTRLKSLGYTTPEKSKTGTSAKIAPRLPGETIGQYLERTGQNL